MMDHVHLHLALLALGYLAIDNGNSVTSVAKTKNQVRDLAMAMCGFMHIPD
jgi:hypothetical protein